MAPPWIWATKLRYALSKMRYSAAVSLTRYNAGKIRIGEFAGCFHNNFFQEKLTSLHWMHNARGEMDPTTHRDGAAVLVRKLLDYPDPTGPFVGDAIVVRDPEKPSEYLVRRLAATEGCEMVSTDEKDEPFVLEHGHCWVLVDNESLTPKKARDSRLFGPVPVSHIYGRVIYSLRTSADHGLERNSLRAVEQDFPVVAVELGCHIQEMLDLAKTRQKK